MPLYDFFAPAYDPAFEPIYLPFRKRALEMLPAMEGATVLELACGTGQNFPLLAARIGGQGKIIGVDISAGMLRTAGRRVKRAALPNVSLCQMDATNLSTAAFQAQTGLSAVDFVVCTYGFTTMSAWETAFHTSWDLLKPGGGYLIHDVHAERRSWRVFAVELATRCNFLHRVWRPLQDRCIDFRMDYIEPSAHLFAGRLFVAYGTKPPIMT